MQEALQKTLKSLLRPQIFILLFIPLAASLLCWVGVFWFFWNTWIFNLTHLWQDTWLVSTLQSWVHGNAENILNWLSVIFLILLFLPMAYITATLLTSIFVMPLMVAVVVKQDYADLEKKRGGSLIGSVWNSLRIGAIYLFALTLTIPLWLIPGGAILIPLILGAWMNKKIFTYDSLQDFASGEEFKAFNRVQRRGLYSLGMLLGLLAYVPLISFVLPVVMGLAYAHFCLSALRDQRISTAIPKTT